MRHSFWGWPAWAIALVLSALMGFATVIFDFAIPAVDLRGIPAWLSALRMATYLAVLVGAIFYAGLVEELFNEKWVAFLHQISAGIIGGAACALLLEKQLGMQTLAMGAVIGAVLSGVGVFGWVARGL